MPFRVIAPYIALALASGLTRWLVTEPGTAAGFYIFALMNAAVFGGLVLLVLWRHARENRLSLFPSGLSGIATFLSVAAIAATVVGGIQTNGAKGLEAINRGITVFTTTQTLFPVAGAGGGQPGKPSIRFRPRWHGWPDPVDASHRSVVPDRRMRPADVLGTDAPEEQGSRGSPSRLRSE